MTMKAGAIIVAAGSGTRMGRPKQFIPIFGKPVVEWSLGAFLEIPEVSQVALVMSAESIREHGRRLASDRVRIVEGGETRMGSVRNGFKALSSDLDVVAVHDGARPLITPDVVNAVIQQAYKSGAALAAVPAKDTLKKVAGKQLWISATPDRSEFWMAQTPQCYRRKILEKALKKFPNEKDATDESQLVERAGHKVKIVPSTYQNIKITTPEDLTVAEAFLERRFPSLKLESRTGFGFDIHRLVPGRELWLGGVRIPHSKGLLGHSDGDVVLHAACDAVLGSSGLGEIGLMFPPENPKIKGIASRDILAEVIKRVAKRGGRITNLDITLVAEEPKIKPHYNKIAASLAELWRVDEKRINFKAKSHEGLGDIGRGDAIACYAVATVSLPAES